VGISATDGGWQKKLPADWDENDTIDWLFEVARKRDDIPSEIILSGRYSSLTGQSPSPSLHGTWYPNLGSNCLKLA